MQHIKTKFLFSEFQRAHLSTPHIKKATAMSRLNLCYMQACNENRLFFEVSDKVNLSQQCKAVFNFIKKSKGNYLGSIN